MERSSGVKFRYGYVKIWSYFVFWGVIFWCFLEVVRKFRCLFGFWSLVKRRVGCGGEGVGFAMGGLSFRVDFLRRGRCVKVGGFVFRLFRFEC